MTDAQAPEQKQPRSAGMSRSLALWIEFTIIGVGIAALFMIFQPFTLTLFTVGCGMVVLAALANNLLPFAEPGNSLRTLLFAAVVVLLILCVALLVAILVAHLYGEFFLSAPTVSLVAARVPNVPFYLQPFYWGIGATALVLFGLARLLR